MATAEQILPIAEVLHVLRLPQSTPDDDPQAKIRIAGIMESCVRYAETKRRCHVLDRGLAYPVVVYPNGTVEVRGQEKFELVKQDVLVCPLTNLLGYIDEKSITIENFSDITVTKRYRKDAVPFYEIKANTPAAEPTESLLTANAMLDVNMVNRVLPPNYKQGMLIYADYLYNFTLPDTEGANSSKQKADMLFARGD